MPDTFWLTYNSHDIIPEEIKNYDPLDIFREAGQNSLDAYATYLNIHLHPRKLLIEDDGTGISSTDMKRYFWRGCTHKTRHNPPPPDWFQGKERKIMYERFKNIRGMKGRGKAAYFLHAKTIGLMTRCCGESKVRAYRLHWHGTCKPLGKIRPDRFPEHGTTIMIDKPRRKIREDKVIDHMSLVFSPIISTEENGGEVTPYSDSLFNIYVNGIRVKPRQWPDGTEYVFDIPEEKTSFGNIKGKIIDPLDKTKKQPIYLYHKGLLVSQWSHYPLTGYLFEDWLDLKTNRNDYVKRNNRRWQSFSRQVDDFLSGISRPFEYKPSKTSSETLLSAFKILRRAAKIYEREQFPIAERRRISKPKTREKVSSKRSYKPPVTLLGLGERIGAIYWRGRTIDFYIDSFSSEEGSVITVRRNNPREHDKVFLNDASLDLEIIRQIESVNVRNVMLADVWAWGLVELLPEYTITAHNLLSVHKEISNTIMRQLSPVKINKLHE